MYAKRITEWLLTLTRPSTVEVRYKDEIVDHVILTEGSNCEDLTDELLEFIKEDAEEAGRTRVYMLISIDEQSQRFVLPLRIRHVIERANHEMTREVAKHNVELIKMLMVERKDDRRLLLDLTDSLGKQLKREQDNSDKQRQRAQDMWAIWEDNQSKHQQRELEREKHEQNAELKERFADILVPLLVAAAMHYTGNKLPLPPVDSKALAVREVAKAMQNAQLDSLQGILGPRWPELKGILDSALDGQVDVPAFRKFAQSLPQETQLAVIQTMNVGQQAALQKVLVDDSN